MFRKDAVEAFRRVAYRKRPGGAWGFEAGMPAPWQPEDTNIKKWVQKYTAWLILSALAVGDVQ